LRSKIAAARPDAAKHGSMPRLLLLLAACVRHGAGFVPSQLPVHSARSAAAAASGLRMMPLGIPKVPYRMPGSQQADWVDIYNRMYRERIIFLGETIDDQIVNQIIAVMLFADSEATQQVESAALLARQLAAPGRLGPPGLGRLGPPGLTDRGRPMHPGGTTQPFRPQWQPATLRRRRPCPSHAAACPLPHSRPLAT
jgi:hypothetical protein